MQETQRAPWRDRLYEIIFEADTRAGQLFDIALLLAILLSVTVVAIETVDDVQVRYGDALVKIEWGFTFLFTIEYLLRLIAVRRPLNYAFSFYGLIDLISILPTYLSPAYGSARSFAIVRSFRLLRVFRILKLIHMTSESEDLAGAIWRARSKVIVFLMFVLITVTIAGTAMYEIERLASPEETHFTSIPQSVYWAVVTMTTVGYGDIVPQTTPGKIVSALLILVGYSLIIVPTGFVSAEFADEKRKASKSTQACPFCMAEGHLTDAVYCRKCGKQL